MPKKKNLTKRNNPYDWVKGGALWKELLDKLQPLIETVKPRNGEISREGWDTPELRMRWTSADQIGRAIQILISPTSRKLIVNGSAWKDSSQERHWKTEELMTVSIRGKPLELDLSSFAKKLRESTETVSGWTEDDLLQTDSLPCKSPDQHQNRKSLAI